MRLVDRTITSLMWMFTGTGAQTLMTVLVTAILARLLTPEQFGLVSAALLVISFTTIFSQSGIGPALIQKGDLTSLHARTAYTFSIIMGGIISALIWFLSPVIANMLNIDGVTPILRVLSISFCYQGFSIVAEAFMQKELRFREIALIRLFSYIIGYGVVGVTLAYLHFGAWALVTGHLLQTSIQALLNIILQPHPKRPSFHTKSLKELLWFGGGHTLARIGNYLALFGDKFVTARWLGPAALGLYERSYQFMVMPAVLIGTVLQQVLFPVLSQMANDHSRLLSTFKRGTSIISLVTIPISVLSVLLAPEIVHIVLGSKWSAATFPFQILAVGIYFRTSYKIADSFTRSVGAVYKRAWVQWGYALLVVVGCIGAQAWGITGISFAVLFALIINYVLMTNLSLRILSYGWRPYMAIHRSGLAAGSVTAVVGIVTSTLCRMTFHLPSIVTLVITLMLVGIVCLLMMRLFPNLFLGEEGKWLIDKLKERFGKKGISLKKESKVMGIMSKAGE
ncbi:lipopolysaccharide biosynthesis protein [Paenibacillus montanisoli]|uniref:Lipopolysaccharide biosynthesis protein n=1 Tax=Paenibacillus montanisoli TaxID=2081970 RepID=A0A328U4G2_9BACL|nr:lipopolysaccharide biosynthesis protein [Paenibacillus montanisoli]RAP77489.1 lipopolysaccharide biosynthesis protein [Paenibacillus montanisoli]